VPDYEGQKRVKSSSSPHRHFTEHLTSVFDEPPRENNLNSKTSSFLTR
jgi:hypothetical protein